jgi:hypothetical protein
VTDAQRDRQPFAGLTESELDAIAERAAKKALQSVYADVGRSVLKKAAWLTGVIVIGLALWLIGKDSLPLK